jgi:excisionase family DNA binding protein
MIQKDDLPEYLTLKEVSELLKVHENTLRNWDKDGTLKANRIGARKLYRYKKEDILKFMESNGQ